MVDQERYVEIIKNHSYEDVVKIITAMEENKIVAIEGKWICPYCGSN
jgi:FtsZ-interacting cell division protein YlmF